MTPKEGYLRRPGGRRLPGKFRAWPGSEKGPGTAERTDGRERFCCIPGQRGAGRSEADFGGFSVAGVRRGVRGRGLVFGTWCLEEELDLSFPGAWCVVTSWVRTLGSKFWACGCSLPTGMKVSLRRASGCKHFPGGLSANTFIAQRGLFGQPAPSSP